VTVRSVRPIFDGWLEPLKKLGARRNVIEPVGSTDHLSFIDAGVPGFNPIQGLRQLRHPHPPHQHGLSIGSASRSCARRRW